MTERGSWGSSRQVLLVCAWCAVVELLTGVVGLFIAGVLPLPLGPDNTAEEVVAFYSRGVHVPFGFMLASLGFALMAPLAAGLSYVMQADPTAGSRILGYAQLSGATSISLIMPCAMVMMATAALRPDRIPDATVMLNDMAWLLFVTPVGVFIVQNVAIATYTLRSPTSLFPRWYGYLNLWVGFTFSFDGLSLIYPDGPFGWNRPLIFWLALTSFAIFLAASWFVLRRVALMIPLYGTVGDLTPDHFTARAAKRLDTDTASLSGSPIEMENIR